MSPSLGLDAFQEANVSGISLPVVKHSYLVKVASDIPRVVREAFYIARSGRPGPVLIDVPKDCSNATIELREDEEFNSPATGVPTGGDPAQVAMRRRACSTRQRDPCSSSVTAR